MSRQQDLRFFLPAPDLVPDTFRRAGWDERIGSYDRALISENSCGYFRRLDGAHVRAAQNQRGRKAGFARTLHRTPDFLATCFG